MGTILEIICEMILMIVFTFPGAFIRWCFTGFRKPFKDLLLDNSEFNGPVGFVAVVGLVILIVNLS
jgi:hypothetical protein